MNYGKTVAAAGIFLGLCLSSRATMLLPEQPGLDSTQINAWPLSVISGSSQTVAVPPSEILLLKPASHEFVATRGVNKILNLPQPGPVPEPSTFVAGSLLLIPFAGGVLWRMVRRR